MALVPANVVGEDVVPEMEPQLPHAGTAADEAAVDEVIGAADLVEDGEVPAGPRRFETAATKKRQRLGRERDNDGAFARRHLVGDELIEAGQEAVVNLIEECV